MNKFFIGLGLFGIFSDLIEKTYGNGRGNRVKRIFI